MAKMESSREPGAHYVPHNRPSFGEDAAQAVARAAREGYWSGGPLVGRFEERLAALTGRRHAVCVASGYTALRLGLMALGVGAGDEVVVPAYSCVALPDAVLALGAVPVPVDVLPGEWTIDPALVRAALTRRTRAVVAVHLFGAPARMPELLQAGPPVVEDCAHALGARTEMGTFGAMGAMAISSFYTTKLLASAKGGVVLTDAAEAADVVRSSRHYLGHPPSALLQNDVMTDIEASLGLCTLDGLDAMLARREELAGRYAAALADLEDAGLLRLPVRTPGRIWYRFVVELRGATVREVAPAMHERGVGVTGPVESWPDAGGRSFPVCETAHRALLSLPLYPGLTDDEQQRTVRALREVLS